MNAAPPFAEHLVIGGGPAGAMAALRLAAAGRRVVLLEREPGLHHKVCGEFLSREALSYLGQAGLDPLALGAVAIRTLRLSSGRTVVETPLPFPALSLSRRVLDQALLARVENAGCRVMRGISAESLASDGEEWVAALNNGQTIRAGAIFLATGKHNLRGFTRTPARQADLLGFKLHWRLARPQLQGLRESIELFLFDAGYGGLSLVEDEFANLCLVVRGSTFRKLQGWPDLLACIQRANLRLRSLLQGAEPLWSRPLAISPIPYGYLAPESAGPWRVGDQAAVIPSFTGDGISIALHSGALAAQMFLAGQSSADYHRLLRQQLRRSVSLATWLSRAAVTAGLCTFVFPALRLFPHAMQAVATSTRIPESLLV
jgi:flavin-dependent dehydrogenase